MIISEKQPGSGEPWHLLLVEDDDSHAELVQLALEDYDHPVRLERVSDGEAAITRMNHFTEDQQPVRPHLILLDLNLPRIDGHDVLARFKSNESWRDIPVVILSTSNSPRDQKRALHCGAAGYLVKPVDAGMFQRLFDDLLINRNKGNPQPFKAGESTGNNS